MPRLVVSSGHRFEIYGRAMKAGDEFECTEREAAVWRIKGWASDAPTQPPQPRTHRGRYSRADMRAVDDQD